MREGNLIHPAKVFDDDRPPRDVSIPNPAELFTQRDAEMEVEASDNTGDRSVDQPRASTLSRSTPATSTTLSSSSNTTPTRKRQPPPTSIPNFPSASEPRNPPPVIPFSPSPTSSPAQPSPFRSPFPNTPNAPPSRSGLLPISQPAPAGAVPPLSPWLHLAATSGAPTPSLDGPSVMRSRGSPQLGYPFEQLNIGGSWSGSNLAAESSDAGRRSSIGDASVPRGAVGAKSPPISRRSSIPSTPVGLAIKSPSKLSNVTPFKIEPLQAASLAPMVRQSTVLILDVRPPSSFTSSHVSTAHSLPIPSTLLRRPAFNLTKLVQMLDPISQDAVSKWSEKSDIVLVDQDTNSVSEGSILQGLASKFEREGYKGKLWYVKGGQVAVAADGKCETSEGDMTMGDVDTAGSFGPLGDSKLEAGLGKGRLGRLAFQQGSTTLSAKTPGLSLRQDPFSTSATTERPPGLSPQAKIQPANPFFDNIRQNLELSHGGITERIPLGLSQETHRRAGELPGFLRDLVQMPEKDSMDKLAEQFYKIELGEQKRLQSIMEWHAKSSGGVLPEDAGKGITIAGVGEQEIKDAEEMDKLAAWNDGAQSGYYPFSITAGVERGSKNRYKNIWPYDFSRVRLTAPTDDQSDYINASYIQPRGTSRRYIATQGPLDATYGDFWSLVWEQEVSVIVMLTKQLEGGLIKCGNYWEGATYGPLHLKLVSQTGGEDKAEQAVTGFDFGQAARHPIEPASNIKRTFVLTNQNVPGVTRQVVQIQCVTWPDFDVPDSPEVLLRLIKDVDGAMEAVCSHTGTDDRNEQPPVLVHCSAGVGRTGSFILVDALLDGLRRERHGLTKRKSTESQAAAVPLPPSAQSSTSNPRLTTHKSDEGKNVSFLFPQTASATSLPAFSTSPVPFATPIQSATSVPGLGEPEMEVDPNPDPFNFNAFMRHRGSIVSESSDAPRRPSLASIYTSSERLSTDSVPRSLDDPRPVTKSNARHRTPSPISELDEPVAEVLEGMRIQRMSLVQSLRQYLFVHRAIIHHYLAMLDEESTTEDTTSRASTAPLSTSTAPTSAGTTDDEAHIKRKPSPTELHPDFPLPNVGASLAKRASVKRMRPTGGLGISGGSGSTSSIATTSTSTSGSVSSTVGSVTAGSTSGSPAKAAKGEK